MRNQQSILGLMMQNIFKDYLGGIYYETKILIIKNGYFDIHIYVYNFVYKGQYI